jgi:hypothetical protein
LFNAPTQARFLAQLAGLALLSVGLCGCVGFWEEISRRDVSFAQRVGNLFVKPDPLVVLRDSHDGDLRAEALGKLREPKQHGGSDREQDVVLAALANAAHNDPQPLCRVAAVHSLGKFKDPRAVTALIDAYYKATVFAPETATVVQCAALRALGETRHPAAVDLLTRVVRAPAPAFDVPDQDKQQEHDRRLAAARALGNFSHYQATEALVHVLRTEKDAALRLRAHEALVEATGKDLGTDAAAWDALMNKHAWDAPVPPPTRSGIGQAGWFEQN